MHASDRHSPPPAERPPGLLGRLVQIRPGEGQAVFWSGAYFFALLSSYYILRPLRDTMALEGSVRDLPWLYLGTLSGTLVAYALFAALVTRFPRRVFLTVVYAFAAANLVVFYVLFQVLVEDTRLWAARVFFVWVSVFNMFVVSVFWAFMADFFRSEQGTRLFGFIGVWGTLGAIVGSFVTGSLASIIDPVHLLPISVLLLVIVTVCISVLTRLIPEPAGARLEASGPSERRDRGGLLNGIVLLARSPYLAGICVYLFLYTLSSTVLYFEQAHIVKESISDAGDRTSFFAWIDFSVNSLTFVTQLLLTGRILTLFGVGTGLALLPALTLGGFAWLSAAPSLTVLAVFQVLRRSMNYAVARPAREVLYTVVGREEKYKAKSFIDTFVYRAGDQIGAWGFELLTVFGLGLSAIALTAVPMAGLWIVVGLLLGHAHRSRARR